MPALNVFKTDGNIRNSRFLFTPGKAMFPAVNVNFMILIIKVIAFMIFELSVLYRIIICLRSICDTAMRCYKEYRQRDIHRKKMNVPRLITFSGALTR